MPLKLYSNVASPPVRSVLFTLKALNLPFEEQHVDVQAGDNMTEEFLKINPAHTIPTLVEDDDFVVFDSHAINSYLVNKYADNDELYPSDCQERSAVDRAMYFECGTMFRALRSGFQQIRNSGTGLTNEIVKMFEETYDILEKLLDGKEYVAKNGITIADFSVITTLTSMNIITPVNPDKFPLLAAYMERCQSNIQGYAEVNEAGLEILRSLFTETDLQLSSD